MSYYAIKYFNEFFTGGRELGSHFITKVLEGIKRLSGYTENPKSPLSSSDLKRAFQYLGGVEMNYKFETYDDTGPFLHGFS